MNVSTFERSFVLVPSSRLEEALSLLAPHFEVAV